MDDIINSGGKHRKSEKSDCSCQAGDEALMFKVVMCLIVLLLVWSLYSMSCKLQQVDGMRSGEGYSAGSNVMWSNTSNRYAFNAGLGEVGRLDRDLTKGAARSRVEGATTRLTGSSTQVPASEIPGKRSIDTMELYKQLISGS